MRMVLIILLIIVGLAYLSQENSYEYKRKDIYFYMMLLFMILLVGLRTYYNDTYNYRVGFERAPDIATFLSNPSNISMMNNPLFYGFQALIKTFTDNYTVLFMICSIFVNTSFVNFIKKHSSKDDFMMSMAIYVCLGTLMLTMAAQKQALTMAFLLYALDALFDKKYIKYYILVILAGCIHTYAWVFLALPFLGDKPWNFKTYLMVSVTLFAMNYFQDFLQTFLSVADSVGKNIASYEVFDGNSMNLFRVAVYSVTPLAALVFKKHIDRNMDRKHGILLQMSIISLMFMFMGTMNGANMFGRCGNYFEIGMIICLPWIISQTFNKGSSQLIFFVALIAFTGFYLYDSQPFIYEYSYKSLITFIAEIL